MAAEEERGGLIARAREEAAEEGIGDEDEIQLVERDGLSPGDTGDVETGRRPRPRRCVERDFSPDPFVSSPSLDHGVGMMTGHIRRRSRGASTKFVRRKTQSKGRRRPGVEKNHTPPSRPCIHHAFHLHRPSSRSVCVQHCLCDLARVPRNPGWNYILYRSPRRDGCRVTVGPHWSGKHPLSFLMIDCPLRERYTGLVPSTPFLHVGPTYRFEKGTHAWYHLCVHRLPVLTASSTLRKGYSLSYASP
jgi:hypothetical protein